MEEITDRKDHLYTDGMVYCRVTSGNLKAYLRNVYNCTNWLLRLHLASSIEHGNICSQQQNDEWMISL